MRILAEEFQRIQWLTTSDVARALDVTANGVRWLVRTRQLACEWTRNGRRLFSLRDVRRLAEKRLTARLVGKGTCTPQDVVVRRRPASGRSPRRTPPINPPRRKPYFTKVK